MDRQNAITLSCRRPASRQGFTMLEVLVALVIFGVITYALGMALSGAIQAQTVSERRQDDNAAVRSVFAALTNDIQSAYASVNSPASLFIAGTRATSSTMQQAGAGGGLLELTTLTQRIQADQLDGQSEGGMLGSQSGQTGLPQSDMALVRYDLDPTSGMLTRTASTVPNAQLIASPQTGPTGTLAQNVVSLTLNFWDPNTQQMRNYWDFEQPNVAQSQSATTGQTGTTGGAASGAASSASAASSSSSTTNGDMSLPSAVQVTLVVRNRSNMTMTYTTTIPITAYQTQATPPINAAGTNPNTTATSSTTTGG